MEKTFFALLAFALIPLLWTAQTATAGDKPFPEKVPVLNGTSAEGFAIGRGTTAYNGSPDGSIYKVDLRSGQGEVLVPVQDPEDCFLLGMRVDRRTNNLFVAGCYRGNAFVFDTDSGGVKMEYQLDSSGGALINDLAITEDAVYFTDADLDGVASGAFHGNSLYVNNARYLLDFPPTADDEFWITKLKIRPLK
jgi:hypothetical protein